MTSIGQGEPALDLSERAMEAGTRSLGAEHTAVLQASIEKVSALTGLDRGDEARALAERIVEGFSKSLGDDHPTTIEARRRLVDHRLVED